MDERGAYTIKEKIDDHRIRLDDHGRKLDELAVATAEIKTLNAQMVKMLEAQEERLREVENIPRDNWKTLLGAVIGCIVMAVFTAMSARYGVR